jgi:hypothetical protein
MKKNRFKIVIGRAELIDFCDHFLTSVPAKIDTGAYRSAVHAQNIEIIERGKKKILSFDLLENHPCSQYSRHIETENWGQATVENSFGESETRYTTNFKVKIGPRTFMSEFTLADRIMKPYPILLGRTLTNGRFLVDSEQSGINKAELKEKFNISMPPESEEMIV